MVIGFLRESEVLIKKKLYCGFSSKTDQCHRTTVLPLENRIGGGVNTSQAMKLKDLDKENIRLKKLVADL